MASSASIYRLQSSRRTIRNQARTGTATRMKRDRHLPAGVYFKHGAYFLVRRNKWHRLGTELSESLQAYAKLIQRPRSGMAAAVDRAVEDIRTRGAANTVRQYEIAARKLRAIFEEFAPSEVKPVHVRQMLTHMNSTPNMANRCRSVLLLAMRLAVEAGEANANPVLEVNPLPERKRERYVTDSEFAAIHDAATPIVRSVMALCYATGQRIGDVLGIKYADLLDEGIAFRQQKTGNRLIVAWTDDLRAVVVRAKELRTVRGFWLICQRNGKPYSYKGMRDAFNRARIASGIADVTLHDLRAKSATDADSEGLNATLLLGHTTRSRTDRYIRQRRVTVAHGPKLRHV